MGEDVNICIDFVSLRMNRNILFYFIYSTTKGMIIYKRRYILIVIVERYNIFEIR
jgi:hypothetical protein